ncbi:TPA: electron transfer flavoprotein subunit beta/FixA family protein [Clostridioides difficile]|uniref:electron transfer flavoprotein subunit beta/FixA family protein n=1 Tax=Clostridioides difficile TaxID=1496 RepID=UPI0011238170|nr:electron transfer flavoprotein subunit beta/FixA family protein [Clostridioides difficile]EJX3388484.1 electron transfer flavoprotein subunit beta/FixA family protein [Clostridioides difficile]TOY49296.1 electron transfer flavoprotein subunit beta [Clostridioides difficile]HBF1807909.1 electron transfer flavoprotein subunit beta/FixA family protein [Clostridioides difficile]HBG5523435.1 electron transfer flavoprotein subunit beta/FixA family protein [Clostridioides difficile]
MNIVVCLKQVPDTNEVKINKETGTLIRDGVPSIINPDDRNALEEALKMKDELGAVIKVISMGPPQAKSALKEALAMGADEAYLISDRAFGGSDTWATSTIIAAAIEKVGKYDVIFCGRQAIDGDTAQVGPEVAEFLGIPQVTYAKEVKVQDDKLLVTRYTETGDYLIEAKMPVLLTAIKELNNPRYPSVKGILEAYNNGDAKITVLTLADLDVDTTQIGLKGSPTNVYKSFVPVKDKHNEIIEGINKKKKLRN